MSPILQTRQQKIIAFFLQKKKKRKRKKEEEEEEKEIKLFHNHDGDAACDAWWRIKGVFG